MRQTRQKPPRKNASTGRLLPDSALAGIRAFVVGQVALRAVFEHTNIALHIPLVLTVFCVEPDGG